MRSNRTAKTTRKVNAQRETRIISWAVCISRGSDSRNYRGIFYDKSTFCSNLLSFRFAFVVLIVYWIAPLKDLPHGENFAVEITTFLLRTSRLLSIQIWSLLYSSSRTAFTENLYPCTGRNTVKTRKEKGKEKNKAIIFVSRDGRRGIMISYVRNSRRGRWILSSSRDPYISKVTQGNAINVSERTHHISLRTFHHISLRRGFSLPSLLLSRRTSYRAKTRINALEDGCSRVTNATLF